MRDRAAAFIIKDKKILMVKVFYDNHYFWTLPGGGIENGETPEQACIRELKEETGIDGEIVRPLTIQFRTNGGKEYSFLCKMKDENQVAINGYDPDEPEGIGVQETAWKTYEELSEIDKQFLCGFGYIDAK